MSESLAMYYSIDPDITKEYKTYSDSLVLITEKTVAFTDIHKRVSKIDDYDRIWLGGEKLADWETEVGSKYKPGSAILVKKGKEYFLLEYTIYKFEVEEDIEQFNCPIFGEQAIPYALSETKAYDLYNFTSFPKEDMVKYFVQTDTYTGPEEDILYSQLI